MNFKIFFLLFCILANMIYALPMEKKSSNRLGIDEDISDYKLKAEKVENETMSKGVNADLFDDRHQTLLNHRVRRTIFQKPFKKPLENMCKYNPQLCLGGGYGGGYQGHVWKSIYVTLIWY